MSTTDKFAGDVLRKASLEIIIKLNDMDRLVWLPYGRAEMIRSCRNRDYDSLMMQNIAEGIVDRQFGAPDYNGSVEDQTNVIIRLLTIFLVMYKIADDDINLALLERVMDEVKKANTTLVETISLDEMFEKGRENDA